jgi:transposase
MQHPVQSPGDAGRDARLSWPPGPAWWALTQPQPRALVAVTELVAQIAVLQAGVRTGFGSHPDVEIYRPQPGLGSVLAAQVLAEIGDAPRRYADAKSRRNHAGTSPVTQASGTKRTVLARHVRSLRQADAR